MKTLKILFFLLLLLIISRIGFTQNKPRVMIIFAHPDEGEIYTGGITALYTQMGCEVKFLSLTNGDAGHYSMEPAKLAKLRYEEAMSSKKILKLTDYEVLNIHDQHLENTKENQSKVIQIIKKFKPDIVFSYYPAIGGHTDNMTAGYIVRDAFRDLNMDKLPVCFYIRDYYTIKFSYMPDFAVPIDTVWDIKLAACATMKTQVADAIPHALGILEEVRSDPEKLKQVLYENTYPFSKVTPDIMVVLKKWVGNKVASTTKYAEAFSVAEFGRQVDDEELAQLLPNLGYRFNLMGGTDWMDTGIDVKVGDTLKFSSTGMIVWKKDGYKKCGPNGNDLYHRLGHRPLLGVSVGALIGRIGLDSNKSFFIGKEKEAVAFESGRLFVGINDDNTTDNEGEFRIWVKKKTGFK